MSLSILTEWLGHGGKPVSSRHAENRGKVCLQCPKHRDGKWWEVNFKEPIAQRIKEHLENKNNLKISVPFEESLGMCGQCGCCCRLLIHVPLTHLLSHKNPNDYPGNCWFKNEAL